MLFLLTIVCLSLFADDSMLFFEANADQALKIKVMLSTYEKGTGQLLSAPKCSILLGNNVSEEDGQATMNALQIEKPEFEEKYLGLHVPDGRMKDGRFQRIKDRPHRRLTDWSEKYMSSGAKETLIKSFIQSMSTYAMSFQVLCRTL
jgi:hypothetical protein